jgi:hypothetical protein
MGTIRFVLRTDKPDHDGMSPIQLIYQLSGQRKYFKTGEKVSKENWSSENQQAIYRDKKYAKRLVPGIDFDLLPSFKEVADINANLTSFKKEITDIEHRFKLNGYTSWIEWLWRLGLTLRLPRKLTHFDYSQ